MNSVRFARADGQKEALARRDLICGSAALLMVQFGFDAKYSGAAAASALEATLAPERPTRSAAVRTWVSPPNCYFAYPHSNGFLTNSGNPVVGQRGGKQVRLHEWDFRSGAMRPILTTSITDMYWDISEQDDRLFLIRQKREIVSINAASKDRKQDYAVHYSSDHDLESLISVSRKARKILYAFERPNGEVRDGKVAYICELDIASGRSTELCQLPFDADHQHYCPHDESWIGFSHEGDVDKLLDRVWGLNRADPRGKCEQLWNQKIGTEILFCGHERWAYHTTGALVVAYRHSPGRPRGLYFVDPVQKANVLISASDYDWHCNLDRRGRFAVVDTLPPAQKLREDDGRLISDIVVIDMKTGARHWVARSHADPHGHPYHPHPHFTPDGKCVVFNDFGHDGFGRASRVVVVELDSGLIG